MLQWLNLFRHLGRLKVFEFVEVKVDFELVGVGIFTQFVFNGEGEMWFEAVQYVVEVIGRSPQRSVDLSGGAIPQPVDR